MLTNDWTNDFSFAVGIMWLLGIVISQFNIQVYCSNNDKNFSYWLTFNHSMPHQLTMPWTHRVLIQSLFNSLFTVLRNDKFSPIFSTFFYYWIQTFWTKIHNWNFIILKKWLIIYKNYNSMKTIKWKFDNWRIQVWKIKQFLKLLIENTRNDWFDNWY